MFSLLIKPCFLQYFLWMINSRSPERVFIFLVYVVCACGLFLHCGHCVGFFILSSSGKIGRWSTFFFQNHSEYRVA